MVVGPEQTFDHNTERPMRRSFDAGFMTCGCLDIDGSCCCLGTLEGGGIAYLSELFMILDENGKLVEASLAHLKK